MDIKAIQELLRLVNKSDLSEVELETAELKIKIKRSSNAPAGVYYVENAPAALPAAAQQPTAAIAPATQSKPEEPPANHHTIKSPMIGTFYRSASPEKPSFVKVGDSIRSGQTLCIIEAMKLFNEIESEVEGTIVKILVENAQPVEYDQPLFVVELVK